MIDWLTLRLPLRSVEGVDLSSGVLLSVGESGVVEWMRPKKGQVLGSYDSRVMVTSVGSFLEVSGNPAKWFQGHNLWGSNDLVALGCSLGLAVSAALGLPVEVDELKAWRAGWFTLSRVDVTAMIAYESDADVRAVLRASAQRARSRHGAAVVRGETVYLGLGSRRWSLKLYSKADELRSRAAGHGIPEGLPRRDELMAWSEGKLRVELQLRGLELDRRGLKLGAAWKGRDVYEVLQEKLDGVVMGERFELPSDEVLELPGRLLGVYEAYRAGHDLRAHYSRATYYRVRRELLGYGVDISLPCVVEEDPGAAVVVPLGRVLEGRLVEVPEWALGSDLYFDVTGTEGG